MYQLCDDGEICRLVKACYAQVPCHRIEWQFKTTLVCDGRIANRLLHRHQLHLHTECPNCKAKFKIPALWVDGHCHGCFMTFVQMAAYQKSC